MEWSGASKAKSDEIWVAGGSRVKTCMRLSVKWVGDHLNLVLGVHCQATIFSSKEAVVALRSLLSGLLISLEPFSCKAKKPPVYRVEHGHHSYYETMSKDLLLYSFTRYTKVGAPLCHTGLGPHLSSICEERRMSHTGPFVVGEYGVELS